MKNSINNNNIRKKTFFGGHITANKAFETEVYSDLTINGNNNKYRF